MKLYNLTTIPFLLLMLAHGVFETTAQDKRWLSYGPTVVQLEGKLTIRMKYGPPNFGENPKTDSKIKVPVLILNSPVSVRADQRDPDNSEVKGAREIQLSLFEVPYKQLIGKRVLVKGTLFHANTGGHYTDLVMSARSINPLPAPDRTQKINHATKRADDSETSFDRQWWKVAVSEEQVGFIDGYYDCYDSDAKALITARGSAVEFQRAVSAFYETHPDQLTTSVPAVLRDLAVTYKSPIIRPQGGEVWSEPHGYYDGTWWKQSEPKEQIGYLKGYVTCYIHEVHPPRARFSQSPAAYRELITQYYAQPVTNEDEKIADVLYQFRDMQTSR